MPEKNMREFCILEGSWRMCSCCQIKWVYPTRISVAPSPSASKAFFIPPPSSVPHQCLPALLWSSEPKAMWAVLPTWPLHVCASAFPRVERTDRKPWGMGACCCQSVAEAVPTLQSSTAGTEHSPAPPLQQLPLPSWCFAWTKQSGFSFRKGRKGRNQETSHFHHFLCCLTVPGNNSYNEGTKSEKNLYSCKTTESSKTLPAKWLGKGYFLQTYNVFHELVGIKAGTELTGVMTRSSVQSNFPVEIWESEFHHNPRSVFWSH